MRKLSVTAGFFVILTGLTGLLDTLHAQNVGQQSQRPVYDIISIREMKMDGNGFMRGLPVNDRDGSFRATGVTANDLITLAYGVRPDHLSGDSYWMGETLYTVSAKSDPSVEQQLRTMTAYEAKVTKRQMLQALLESRFQLRVHPFEANGTVYALVCAKGGPKFSASPTTTSTATPPSAQVDKETMTFHQFNMDRFAQILSQIADQEIVNKTGLIDRYDYTLRYQQTRASGTNETDMSVLDDALDNQLGLQLKSAKGTVDGLVIEHIERPSPN